MKRTLYTLIALFVTSLSAMAQGYHLDFETRRVLDEADRVLYEAERSTYYDGRRPPRQAEVIRYVDNNGRRRQVNRDAYGNYYDYSTYSCYQNATNTHRNPRYSDYYPTNGYYNGQVYIGTDRPYYYDRSSRGYYNNGAYYSDNYGYYNNGYYNNGRYSNSYYASPCGGSMSQAQAQSMSSCGGSMSQAQAQSMSAGGCSMSQAQAQSMSAGGCSMSQSQSQSSSSCNNNININYCGY